MSQVAAESTHVQFVKLTEAEIAAYVKSETAWWTKAVKDAGIEAE